MVFLVHLSCLPMLTIFLFLLSGGLSSCLILLEIPFNRFPFIFLGCKWPNIICCSFSINMPMFSLSYRWYVTLSSTIMMLLLSTIGCSTRMCVLYHITCCHFCWSFTLFLTCRRWLYFIWFIMCSITEMYFVLAQFVCSHPQPCSFLFWFIVVLYVCHKLVSSIYQHHIDVPLNVSSLWLFCSEFHMSFFIRKRYVILLYHSFSDDGWWFTPSYWKWVTLLYMLFQADWLQSFTASPKCGWWSVVIYYS